MARDGASEALVRFSERLRLPVATHLNESADELRDETLGGLARGGAIAGAALGCYLVSLRVASERAASDAVQVLPSVRLPAGWKFGTALNAARVEAGRERDAAPLRAARHDHARDRAPPGRTRSECSRPLSR